MNQQSAKALSFVVILISVWLAAFSDALLSMVAIWDRSDTFAHGYIVYPISLYLIWRRRFLLQEATYNTNWLALIPLMGCSALWLAAEVVGIQVLAQLAAVAWLPFALWALFGNALIKIIWFPLCYLIFAVPMGEELIPQLQIITADITVFLLQLTGIAVYRDGLYIAVPGGLFEVAVACSGIRYLIASIALGTLYAHLQFHSIKRQFLFVLLSAIVPIIANGIRAYIIVILAYASDMALATGVDHLIYGWLFFGLVMFLLFWFGSYWQQPTAEPKKCATSLAQFANPIQRLTIGVVVMITLVAGVTYENHIKSQQPPAHVLNTTALNQYFTASSLTSWQPKFLNADSYFEGKGNFAEQEVQVYIAFFGHSSQDKELINATHLIFNHEAWTPERHRRVQLGDIDAGFINLTSAFSDKVDLAYWYQLDGLASPAKSKIKIEQAIRTLRSESNSGMVVILATPHSNESQSALTQAATAIRNIDEAWHGG
ncbi:exosortase A [Echinimonas agarilytica]|uniref:Exosortase A n=1 Tax=Echinimonas agarilytica TaxID=1215918 RepID=A0AA42B8W8_9GAMM|nr:exosortase A [Echinimonas agarilytica]MCM2681474.1 exosortase A [Echinimonas agarilytica]